MILIERKIMEAELILDGLFTHNNFKGCMNPIHAKRIGKALSAVKSARDILRNDMKSKQPTLTTRGSKKSKFNRHHLWECNAIPEWHCDCKLPFKVNGIEQEEEKGNNRHVQTTL